MIIEIVENKTTDKDTLGACSLYPVSLLCPWGSWAWWFGGHWRQYGGAGNEEEPSLRPVCVLSLVCPGRSPEDPHRK